jgi:2-dehydro-3-deoxygluconokinase
MDLVTFGEAMLRLTPPGSQSLAQAKSFDAYVGGAELNVAVAAAKLGVETRWVSRLPENAIGRMIADRAKMEGVDVSYIEWARDGRAGIYFVEVGAEPGTTNVTYDRSGSAMARIQRGMIDWPRVLRGTRWLHVSGITPALSETAAATLVEALRAAKNASVTISYDLNFRPKLWRPERARAAQEPLLRFADVFIASEESAQRVFNCSHDSAEALARDLQDVYRIPAVVITLRDSIRTRTTWNAVVVAEGEAHHASAIACDVVEPMGAGDAFSAGLLYGRLRGESWESSVHYGAALAALKHGTPGDFSRATLDDVMQTCERGTTLVSR